MSRRIGADQSRSDSFPSFPASSREAIESAVSRFARPGAWLDSQTRIDIVLETRQARDCRLCLERIEALSPYTVSGQHDRISSLPDFFVELTHRLSTDPGRITGAWAHEILEFTGPERYVEAVSLVSTGTVADTFCLAFGIEVLELPPAQPGEPSQISSSNVVDVGAFVPVSNLTEPPERWSHMSRMGHVRASLGLVPAAFEEFWDLFEQLEDSTRNERPDVPFGPPQIEFVRSRVSALNSCFY